MEAQLDPNLELHKWVEDRSAPPNAFWPVLPSSE